MHDLLIILGNVIAVVLALGLLLLLPYLLCYLAMAFACLLGSLVPLLLAEMLFAHTSIHDQAVWAVGMLCTVASFIAAVPLTVSIFRRTL